MKLINVPSAGGVGGEIVRRGARPAAPVPARRNEPGYRREGGGGGDDFRFYYRSAFGGNMANISLINQELILHLCKTAETSGAAS